MLVLVLLLLSLWVAAQASPRGLSQDVEYGLTSCDLHFDPPQQLATGGLGLFWSPDGNIAVHVPV